MHSTKDKDTVGSKFIITFWTDEEYRELQRAGFPEWRDIDIRNDPCSAEQRAELVRAIEKLITKAIDATKNTSGFRVKSGKSRFVYSENCQAQWFPVYNVFNLRVEDGEGGKCEKDEKCFGAVFLETGNGLLDDVNGRNNDGKEFYDSTTKADGEQLESRHAGLREPQS